MINIFPRLKRRGIFVVIVGLHFDMQIFLKNFKKGIDISEKHCIIITFIQQPLYNRRNIMPPKAKITREMVINAAFEIARTNGAKEISARTVAERLGTSTQPVMYHFSTIAELKRVTYAKVNTFHTEYITKFDTENSDIMYEIVRRYI